MILSLAVYEKSFQIDMSLPPSHHFTEKVLTWPPHDTENYCKSQLVYCSVSLFVCYRMDKTDVGDRSEGKSRDREAFDSRQILQLFGNYRYSHQTSVGDPDQKFVSRILIPI